MKTTLFTILLALTASQANADGFYQQVVSNWQQSSQAQEINGSVTETTHTPTYMQAVIQSRQVFDQGKVVIRTPSKTTYTPLYLQVVGRPEVSVGGNRIAGDSNSHANTGS